MVSAFAPFIVFALGHSLLGTTADLCAAAAVLAALLIRDRMTAGRSPKVLEIGSFVLFGGLAVYSVLFVPAWSVVQGRLYVDFGLFLIAATSIVIRRPFTLRYAREKVGREYWDSPRLVRTNYLITAAWALAFSVLVLADLTMVHAPGVPQRVGIIATVLALLAAFKFTGWYPEHAQSEAATQ